MTLRSSHVLAVSAEDIDSQRSQTNRIRKLPPLLVNQLAAGEVVTRPASVVKELIENAIDAGARCIDIRITQGGLGVIEVCDDGCGIHAEDMVMAVTRFATSKIADVAQLQGIATLGFRGEALAATAAVSRLTLRSSADQSGIGRELTVAGILEDTPALMPVVHPQGTTVTVRDLYFNVPARRGNLKAISTEYAHIEAVVKQLALVASDVSFSLWHNDKRRFSFEAVNTESSNRSFSTSLPNQGRQTSPVIQSALARFKAILPSSPAQARLFDESQLQPINIDLEGLRSHTASSSNQNSHKLGIAGFLIPQAGNNSSTNNAGFKLIYINGRLVKDRRIAQSMRESAEALQNLGYVLFFTLPKAWLNLNVHPSKQCIKIQNLANVMAHLEVGVRDALQVWHKKQPKQAPAKHNESNAHLNNHRDVQSGNYVSEQASKYETGHHQKTNGYEQNTGCSNRHAVQESDATSNKPSLNSLINQQGVRESLIEYDSGSIKEHQVTNNNVVFSKTYFVDSNDATSPLSSTSDYSLTQYQCVYLLDNNNFEQQSSQLAVKNLDSGKGGLALIQTAGAMLLLPEDELLQCLSDHNDSEISIIDDYYQLDGVDAKRVWINQKLAKKQLSNSFSHRISHCNDTEDDINESNRIAEAIERHAICELSLPELIGLMLK